MNLGIVFHRALQIAAAMVHEPLVYLPLVGAWFITELYFIVNCDEAHGHTYVMSTGIALIFTAFMISPLAIDNISWTYSKLRTLVVVLLFLYGCFLVLFGILRLFPHLLAEFFGAPGHALVPSMMVVLYIQHDIAFDWTTFIIIASPVLLLGTLKTLRRMHYRIFTSRTDDE